MEEEERSWAWGQLEEIEGLLVLESSYFQLAS